MGHKIEAIFTKQRHNSKVTVAERMCLIICQSELGFKRTCFSRSHIRLKSEQKIEMGTEKSVAGKRALLFDLLLFVKLPYS